jgi:hypothetical protein
MEQPRGSAGKQVQRDSVGRAAIEFGDGVCESRIGCDRAEQRHRRAEFKVVGTAEYFPDGSALNSVDQRRALGQAGDPKRRARDRRRLPRGSESQIAGPSGYGRGRRAGEK